jgi:hypothetical protein
MPLKDPTSVSCQNCGSAFNQFSRFCPGCNSDWGFPNVRAASRAEEIEALKQRCADADISANARECKEVLSKFVESVKDAKAVINRSVGDVQALICNENALYTTFYHSVDAQARLPEDNPYDMSRTTIDSMLFPFYHQEMRFAALSIDGRGLPKYGALTMVLRDNIIKHRATVFEENSFEFCKRQKIVVGSPLPLGYRTTWEKKHELAAAKLHSRITTTTSDKDFGKILLQPGAESAADDFIEVHIYGSLNSRGIERVVGKLPSRKADRVLLKSIEYKLQELGAKFELG